MITCLSYAGCSALVLAHCLSTSLAVVTLVVARAFHLAQKKTHLQTELHQMRGELIHTESLHMYFVSLDTSTKALHHNKVHVLGEAVKPPS